ncbi:MAG: hypothetical protein ACTSU5_19045 [Promethearchaeota archaeon]
MDIPEVKIRCMHCHREGKLNVPGDVHEARGTGIANVLVEHGVICPHEFVAFVDKNFKVRGYSPVDYITSLGSRAGEPEVTRGIMDQKLGEQPSLSPEEQERARKKGEAVFEVFNEYLKSPGMLSLFLLEWNGRVVTGVFDEEYGFEEISGVVTEIMALGTQVGDRLKLADVQRFHMIGRENDAIVEKVGGSYVIVAVFSKDVKLGLFNFEIKQLKKKISPILYDA